MPIKETAETAQEQEKEEGIITRIGEFVSNAFDPDGQDQQAVEATKQIFEGLGGKVDEKSSKKLRLLAYSRGDRSQDGRDTSHW